MSFLNEGVHLDSACPVAGFRHVIGTSWEVKDESCVEIAEITTQCSSEVIRGHNAKRSPAQISCASPMSSPLEFSVFSNVPCKHRGVPRWCVQRIQVHDCPSAVCVCRDHVWRDRLQVFVNDFQADIKAIDFGTGSQKIKLKAPYLIFVSLSMSSFAASLGPHVNRIKWPTSPSKSLWMRWCAAKFSCPNRNLLRK